MWYLPQVVEGKIVAHIKTRQAAEKLREEKKWTLNVCGEGPARNRSRAVIKAFRPGVRKPKSQPLCPARHVHIHAVVGVRRLPGKSVDYTDVGIQLGAAGPRRGPDQSAVRSSGRHHDVGIVGAPRLVDSMFTYISSEQHDVAGELTLNIEIPLLD